MDNNADQATEVSQEPGTETPADTADLPVGHILNRRFVIEAVLGRGGVGVVYRALDLRKQEALPIYDEAYQLHPRSRWITDKMEEVFTALVDTHLADPQAGAEARAALPAASAGCHRQ